MSDEGAANADGPAVSVVVPARNEEAHLPATLDSIRGMETELTYELIVVDGGSEDRTWAVAESRGATVVDGGGGGIGHGRHVGARRAAGDWYAFVDADTVVDPDYLDAMLSFVRERGLVAAAARCRMPGLRSKPMQATINRAFPRLASPVLPGFSCFVDADAYRAVGGFPNVPNEDTAFSRKLARHGPTGYHPRALVETSARRIERSGLSGTLWHYLRLDWRRLRADY